MNKSEVVGLTLLTSPIYKSGEVGHFFLTINYILTNLKIIVN